MKVKGIISRLERHPVLQYVLMRMLALLPVLL